MRLKLPPYVREFLALDCSNPAEYEAFIASHHPGIARLADAEKISRETAFKEARTRLIKSRSVDKRIADEQHSTEERYERGTAAYDRISLSWPTPEEMAAMQAALKSFVDGYKAIERNDPDAARKVEMGIGYLNVVAKMIQPHVEVLPSGALGYKLVVRHDLKLEGGGLDSRAWAELLDANGLDPTATAIAAAGSKKEARQIADEIWSENYDDLRGRIVREAALGDPVSVLSDRYGVPRQTINSWLEAETVSDPAT